MTSQKALALLQRWLLWRCLIHDELRTGPNFQLSLATSEWQVNDSKFSASWVTAEIGLREYVPQNMQQMLLIDKDGGIRTLSSRSSTIEPISVFADAETLNVATIAFLLISDPLKSVLAVASSIGRRMWFITCTRE